MRGSRGALAGSLALLLACAGEAPTGIVLEVDSDLMVPAELDAVRITVRDDQGAVLHDQTLDLRGGLSALPGRLALQADDPANAPALAIQAIALRETREVMHAEAHLGFRRGAVVLLRLPLLAQCLCQPCGAGTTCLEGPRCAPVAVDVDTLPGYEPRGSAAPREPRPAIQCEPTDGPGPEGDGGAPPADGAPPPPPPDGGMLLPTGAACGASNQCASRSCADGICCASACATPCMACARALTGAADGTCAPIQAGTDPRNDCTADPASSCRFDGTCDGAGHCRLYGATTLCGSASCNGGAFFAAARCTGTGGCSQASGQPCGLFACSTSQGCLTACQADGDCSTTAYCTPPSCVAKKGNNQPCTAPRECLSEMCQNNRCRGN